MLTEYVQRAMRHARYELMENGRFFGCIPECPGTWGDGAALEECRDELQSVLEDWLMVGIRFGDALPVIDGIDLNPEPAYAQADQPA
jgi:predicted RNase H-like HicB family nuclease